MKKLTNLIVKHRYFFLSLFIVGALFCIYLQTKVNINDNIMNYLPKNSETKIGNDVMNKEFDKLSTSDLNVMFKNLSSSEKKDTYEKLSKITGVSSVKYDNTKEFNKGKYTLYKLSVDDYSDSKLARSVYNKVDDDFNAVAMSGSIFDENKPLLQLWIVFLAISCALIILIILSDSWFEPFLYLISIGIAVFINKGTNVMFISVSSITNAIVAVLQLALSMDYSIMLSNRFKQEKKTSTNNVEAMKKALYQSFKAISSSSLTTVVGLLALVFMSFTIGKDLGFVLAKGVILSLISIFFCLPALLLLFDKFIDKTKKKSFNFKLNRLAESSYNRRYIKTILVVILFAVAFLLKGNIQILYTDIQQDKVGQVFGNNNQIAIVYENKYSDDVNNYLFNLADDKVTSVLSYDILIKEELSADELLKLVSSFSSSVEIDSSLVKFIYYMKFDGKVHENISINELINIIKNNKLIYEHIKSNYNINLSNLYLTLKPYDLDKKYNLYTLSDILGVNDFDLNLVYLFYNSNKYYNESWKLTAEDLFLFIKEQYENNDDLTKLIPSEKRIILLAAFSKVSNIKNILVSDKYSRAVINSSYKQEGKDTFKFIKNMKDELGDKKGIYVVGVSPMAYEINQSFNGELNRITLLTIIFIFIVVAFTFKDLIIPFVLVLMIQTAVYITMSYISLTGGSVYFIALLIVQAILMGATIDYAIVYTSYYKEARLTMNVKDAILHAYNGSIRTIISSASTLIIVTLMVSNFATAIAAKICETVSQGTLCAAIIVLILLPGVLATCDKLICRGKNYKR